MGNFKRYDTESNTTFAGVFLVKAPERVTAGSSELVKLTFVQDSSNDRYVPVFTVATFRADDKRYGKTLARLQKGDQVSIGGRQEFRKFPRKGQRGLDAVGIEAEIRYPTLLRVHTSMKDREEPEAEAPDDTDAKPDAADEGADEEGFLDDEE